MGGKRKTKTQSGKSQPQSEPTTTPTGEMVTTVAGIHGKHCTCSQQEIIEGKPHS